MFASIKSSEDGGDFFLGGTVSSSTGGVGPTTCRHCATPAILFWLREAWMLQPFLEDLRHYRLSPSAVRDREAAKVKIDAAYVAVNTPIIRKQLQKSGVSLAHMLDATLG